VVARLKAGGSPDAAQAEMEAICARIAAEYPSNDPITSATVRRLHDSMTENSGPIPAILMGAVLTVFLVACANVAGLMFARGVTREREMALRSALGATRLRLMRLILMEDVVLALFGGGLGLLASTWVVQLLLAMGVLPADAFPVGFFRPDRHVFGFALLLSLLGAPACGLLPSLRCSSSRLARTLAAGSRSVLGSRGYNAAHTGLLAAQVALTIVLLIAAGLMIRSLFDVFTADRGFDSHNVLVMDLHLLGENYAGEQSQAAFHRQLLDRLGAIRGVEKAALTGPLFSTQSQRFHVEGEAPAPPGQQAATASYRAVSPGYFQAMGIQLLRGRFFEDSDRLASSPVVIVDQTLALRYWPNGDWIGKRLKMSESDDPNVPRAEIVGVVRHVRDAYETQARMQMYLPLSQKTFPRVSIVLRTARRPQDFVAAVKDAVYQIDRQQLISKPRTLDEALWYDTLVRRFVASLLSASAGIALFLSAVGIYAVTRYSIARRTQEFGIRLALGADRRDVLWLVLRKALVPVLIGLGAGLAVTLVVARVLSSLLTQLSPWDPATYAAVSLLLAAVTVLAGYLPARRAAKVDPMVALRYE
jgi:predicted permease